MLSEFTFPERATKVTRHCSLQRETRDWCKPSKQSIASSVTCFPCTTVSIRPARKRTPFTHPRFPQARKETWTAIFPCRWILEDCWCLSRLHLKAIVFFISQQKNFSEGLALGITTFTLFTENRPVTAHFSTMTKSMVRLNKNYGHYKWRKIM